MEPTILFSAVVQLLLLWLAISVHEAAHAWAADRCGDATARLLGRVSLNPLRHIEPFGSVFMPLLLVVFSLPTFGWGRPPLVSPKNLRRPYWNWMTIAAAGPLANLAVTLLALGAVAVAVAVLGGTSRQAALVAVMDPLDEGTVRLSYFPLMFTLTRLATINGFVALLNAMQVLPADWAAKLAAVAPYGRIIGVVLTLIAMPVLLVLFYFVIKVI
jgi:hypothetical protein